MLTTLLDTARLPSAERAEAWAETTAQALVTTRLSFLGPGAIRARIQAMELGRVQLSLMSYTPLSSVRTPLLIRRSDPETYQIALTLGGRQSIEQARTYAPVRPGDLLLYDSSRPFTATAGPGAPGTRSLVLQFPRRSLPLPERLVAPLCGTKLSGRTGVGLLLSRLLTGFTEAQADLTVADGARLGATAVDLTAALLAHHADRTDRLPAGARQRALFEQIGWYITRHLHDPGLGPGSIAAAHFISTRYLHRVFQQHGTTVGAVVREQRITRCRRDLADPALRHVPVSSIGMRWGFPRPSDFSRAFRAATGTTPTEYRAAGRQTG